MKIFKKTGSLLLVFLLICSTFFVGIPIASANSSYTVLMYNGKLDENNFQFTKSISYKNAIDGKSGVLKKGMNIELFLVGPNTSTNNLNKYVQSYSKARSAGYEQSFCVYPNASVPGWANTGYYTSHFNKYYNKMSSDMKKALGYLSSVGVPGTYQGKAACYATQIIYWEFITGKRSTTNYKASTKLINYISQKSNKSNAISLNEVKDKYNAISAALEKKASAPSGSLYDANKKSWKNTSYYKSMREANSHSPVVGKQTSLTATYKFTYKAKIDNPSSYKNWTVVNSKGKKASGKNGKFKLSVSGKTITLQSKGSTKDYKDSYFLTFEQNNKSVNTKAGTNATFGVNSSSNYSMQNIAQGFSTPTQKYYIKLQSTTIPPSTGKLMVSKSVRDTSGQDKTSSSYLSGWGFKVTGPNTNVVLVTKQNGDSEPLLNRMAGKYTITEIGRKITGSTENYTNVVATSYGTFGFPKNYVADETRVRVAGGSYSKARSKTITLSGLAQVTFDYINYVKEVKKVRVWKTTDEGPASGFYFKIYDANKENNCIKTQIVGPTKALDNGEFATDFVETLNNNSFKLGVKELGKYVSGDKNKESSYAIPEEYDTPEGDTFRTINANETTVTVKVHNSCSGNIVLGKIDTNTGKYITGATYGIFYNKVFADKQSVDREDYEETKTEESNAESSDDINYSYEDGSEAEDTDDSEGTGENDTDIEKDSDKLPDGVIEETDSSDSDNIDITDSELIESNDENIDVTDIPEIDPVLPENGEDTEYSSASKWLAQGNNLADVVEITKEGFANFSNSLPLGKYYIQELSAPDGYLLSDEVIEVKVDFGRKNTNAVRCKVKDEPTKVAVSKTDITGEKELEGAKLEVIDKDNNVIDSWTSTSEPHMIYALNIDETYILREIIAPEGYATTGAVRFTVKNTGEIQKITLKDEITKVEISKKDLTTSEELEGAKLEVVDKDNNVVESWTSTTTPHIIKGLISGETYTLRETIAPKGYATTSDIQFAVQNTGEVQKVVMKDEITQVEISKKDLTTSEELEGAKLEIIDKNNNVVESWTSTTTPHIIKGLINGETYTLRETIAPDGYVTTEDIEFTVKDTSELQKIEMFDDITKVNIKKIGENGYLKGAKLQVLDDSGNVVDSWTTDGNEHRINKLVSGKEYTLTELSAPSGYATAEDITFTVEDKNTVQTITMVDKKTKIEISKTDITGSNEIKGAKLLLTNSNNKTVDKWTSNGSPHMIKGLKVGETYTLTETYAPKGYAYAESIVFTVEDTSDIQKITMKDKPTSVNIKKVNKDGDLLSGAVLQILDEDENNILTFKTTDEVKVIEKVLEAGKTYTLRELKAPKGYTVTEDVTFTVPLAGMCSVKMVDTKIIPTTPPTKTGSNNWVMGIVTLVTTLSGVGVLFIIAKKSRKSRK